MSPARLLLLIVLCISCFTVNAQKQLEYSFDLSDSSVVYHHYWKSTGYTPASMTTEQDFKLYLNMVEGMRGQAIEYVRPHFLLNHVKILDPGTDNQSYEWEELDEILDLLVEADLKLIFEIMMSPHPYFDDWYDRTKLEAWKAFCQALVVHLEDRYGQEVIRSWYFESINEPDIGYWWPYGPIQFLYYYDATAQGIHEADSVLRFGGPGAAFGLSTVYEVFIDHAANGLNFYTGERNVKCDFITWHRKFTPHAMVNEEIKLNDFLSRYKDRFKGIPVGNDEADPIAGWNKPFWWRPKPWYAAFVAQSVDLHNQAFVDEKGADYFVLSNDNAFMGDWYKRTHLARFRKGGDANDLPEEQRNQFYVVKKPVFTVMSLLAMQGSQRYLPKENPGDSTAGVIVSKNANREFMILSYNKPEIKITHQKSGTEPDQADQRAITAAKTELSINLKQVPPGDYTLVQYRIDDKNGNPYQTWEARGKKEIPSSSELLELLRSENPVLTATNDLTVKNNFLIATQFESSGVELACLLRKPARRPNKIINLKAHTYIGANGEQMVMLNWKHADEMHIKSFDIYFSPIGERKFQKVNQAEVLDRSFLHIHADNKGGKYRIEAVDYWGRKSGYSEVLNVSF
ncbi:MAG: hypothetical protein AAFX87_22815 [Bacteroidota bacterium]